MKQRVEIDITIRSGRAYLPTLYRDEKHRLYFGREPVLVVDLTRGGLAGLVEAVRKKREEGNPRIEVPDLQEYLKRKGVSPVAKVAGFKSWGSFFKKARAYGISFLEDKIVVEMSGPAKGGALIYDAKKTREFAADASLEEVVRVIWEDICSIPELWE